VVPEGAPVNHNNVRTLNMVKEEVLNEFEQFVFMRIVKALQSVIEHLEVFPFHYVFTRFLTYLFLIISEHYSHFTKNLSLEV